MIAGRGGLPGRTPWCPCATGCLSGPTGTRSSWKQKGAMQRAYKRRLRPGRPCRAVDRLSHAARGPGGPGRTGGGRDKCGRAATRLAMPCDADSNQILSRTGLLARRANVVKRAWVRVPREAVGPEGQVVPQQWLAHTTAPGVHPQDRRRLDLVVYGATTRGGALCCDAARVSPLTRTGHPQPCAVQVDGARPAGCRASQAGS